MRSSTGGVRRICIGLTECFRYMFPPYSVLFSGIGTIEAPVLKLSSEAFCMAIGLASAVDRQRVGLTVFLGFNVGVAYHGVCLLLTLLLCFGMSSPCFIRSSFPLMLLFALCFLRPELGVRLPMFRLRFGMSSLPFLRNLARHQMLRARA